MGGGGDTKSEREIHALASNTSCATCFVLSKEKLKEKTPKELQHNKSVERDVTGRDKTRRVYGERIILNGVEEYTRVFRLQWSLFKTGTSWQNRGLRGRRWGKLKIKEFCSSTKKRRRGGEGERGQAARPGAEVMCQN
ncbi:hypothetical protein POVWA2_081480 [Plasmodium ovale wallikeri]|uniref:Uncharacterized protein n=1 Tax=Plasmodium ovale wallikeri TaxID=864142 RepID=A0A1A9ANV8_PLAOA|nr:hypothetical protein POVWA1_026200 [Plasmodium ovale wallikeri]SBT57773.1 hypothetical protein POVWA2_081480 [Plasmodium ovale wallikeri]